MPKIVCSRLEKIQTREKTSPRQLENSLRRKKEWGLGVRSLSKMNKALFCKWCWRFANERGSLWRLVISTKFGKGDGG